MSEAIWIALLSGGFLLVSALIGWWASRSDRRATAQATFMTSLQAQIKLQAEQSEADRERMAAYERKQVEDRAAINRLEGSLRYTEELNRDLMPFAYWRYAGMPAPPPGLTRLVLSHIHKNPISGMLEIINDSEGNDS